MWQMQRVCLNVTLSKTVTLTFLMYSMYQINKINIISKIIRKTNSWLQCIYAMGMICVVFQGPPGTGVSPDGGISVSTQLCPSV